MDQRFQAMLGAIVAGASQRGIEVERPLVRIEAAGEVGRQRWAQLVREAVDATPDARPWATVVDLALASITAQVNELVAATIECRPKRPIALIVPCEWKGEAHRWFWAFANQGITMVAWFEDEREAVKWATHWGRYQ